MDPFTKKYTDLDRAIDEVRTLSDDWPASQQDGTIDDETLHCTCLVLHEWIANLHQHACFQNSAPMIEIRLTCDAQQVTCSVLDNSDGFDLDSYLPADDEDPEAFPERGMGLRIIKACTGKLAYSPTEDGLHRFEFLIPSDHDPWLNTLF
ncbi:ATP-binding protein [Salinibacter grassmerensis]|uniref:ATP-binding protein n=1 Tax=Salinibacter grassmerensis TaxID=3040353 RepID=UPI0021E7435E|nr:ATP-binding protein [Salinibacter grassmerensis]